MDWSLAVVVDSDDLPGNLQEIAIAISKHCDLNYLLFLNRFGDDRALFFCKNMEESLKITLVASLRMGTSSIFLNKYSRTVNTIDSKVSAFRGWILIKGLPFDCWKTHIFESIAQDFGGLMEVDRNTENLSVLLAAKIRIKSTDISTIPHINPLPSAITPSPSN